LVCACQWLAAKAFDAKSQGRNNFYNFLKLKKMGIQKMSLANIKGKLSRAEMKNIMAGSGCAVVCGPGTAGTYWIGSALECGSYGYFTNHGTYVRLC
jgi:hypothetical protein